jgi:hypothetical protein
MDQLMCQLWLRLGANFVELRKGEVRRIPILGTSVNKGEPPNEYLLIPAFRKFIANSLVPASIIPLEEGNGEKKHDG